MTRDEAVTRIQRGLVFRSDLVTEIIEALQDTQDELEMSEHLPWFLKTEIASISTTKDEERVLKPSNFLREVDEDTLFLFDSTAANVDEVYTPLFKDYTEFLRQEFPGTGPPQAYSLTKDYFRLFPTPDAVFVLKMVYYKRDLALTTNIENEWLRYAHDLMIGQAGLKLSSYIRDNTALQLFGAMETRGRQRMVNDTAAREASGFRYVMGGRD